MKKVFISYSHKDEQWKDRLQPHLRALEQQGDISLWDDRRIGIGENWYPEIKNELDKAAVAICLISADFLASDFINKEEIPDLKKQRSEEGMLLLPILVSPCPWKTIQWLKGIQMFPRDGKSIAEIRGKVKQEKALSEIAEYVYEKINEPEFQLAAPATEWTKPEKLDIDRLPETSVQLFGRKKELQLLDEMWDSGIANVISLVAWGGVGKSTLINRWLQTMGVDNYRGAKKVFGWSFYSQGTSERVTSADKFISEALAWFGDENPTKGSPWDKGQRLADLVRKEKTLLILDGLEPLQSGYDYEKGKIKDPALSMLVTQLARNNNGLCVITTREQVAELANFDKNTLQRNLDQISKEAGRALLRVGGVQGTDAELEAASEQFGNHALAINLLASYLHGIEGHHISNAKNIPDLDIPEEKGRHPRRVIAAFEERFGEGPKVQLLNILGLFDRLAELAAIEAVYAPPPIEGLTDHLQDLNDGQWNELFEELRVCKLLARKSKHNPNVLDCHPLVREHFGEKLKKDKPEAWRQAHSRLYEYYKVLPEKLYGKFLPDTLEEMEPLFAAVMHGCQSELHQETFDDVYWKRILRGNEDYVEKKIGAFGAHLAVVSYFFEKPWSKPASSFSDRRKALVLNFAGFAMRALGRLTDAVEPTKGSLARRIRMEDWAESAKDAGNLSELYLTLGDVKKAVDYSLESVEYANKSEDNFWRFKMKSRLANSLFQLGEILKSKQEFQEAEKKHPYRDLLVSVEGSLFCDLLLMEGFFDEVQKRSNYSLKEWSEKEHVLLDIALDKLSLGQAYMLEAVVESRGRSTDDRWQSKGFVKAEDFLNQAVDGLRKAGSQDHLPRGLFARGELYRYQQSWEKAWTDLKEAREIAERGQMNLYMADFHLEAARLCLAEGNREAEARENFTQAEALVRSMGYHRRDPEVLLIQAELEIVEGKKATAKKTLKTAEARINEMGCHRWDIELERIRGML